MKNYRFIFALWLVLAAAACQQAPKQESVAESADNKEASSLQTDTIKVYNAYLQVKDNLVKSDGSAAKKSAGDLADHLKKIKGCSEAEDLADKIGDTEDVKSQRMLFLQLSNDVIPLIKGMSNKAAPVYVAYCPMANEGKGGYWLSAQKEIKNPYYGDEMLECGEIKEEIK
ncbi:DUF3347 domain-containing protein [Mucilaginibacter sp. PAMB04274]|uniref:DUF3347 domain-containing protein n=1 Tax=Mucilaginibacter sp. PAMB04274 TaxID=3138568 RepID=UPI0031F6AE6D